MRSYLLIQGMNPEPWKAPGAQVGRRRGGTFATLIKDGRLDAYQSAIGEALEDFDVKQYDAEAYLAVEMFFFRQLEEYTPTLGRKTRRKWADATNMGKALEDALQGHLYPNDSMVVAPVPRIIDQRTETSPVLMAVVSPMRMETPVLQTSHWPNTLASLQSHLNPHGVAFVQM